MSAVDAEDAKLAPDPLLCVGGVDAKLAPEPFVEAGDGSDDAKLVPEPLLLLLLLLLFVSPLAANCCK